jgi:hypothetical protein
MKASKFALVIAFVAFATMVFAQVERPNQNEPAPAPICVKILLENALLDHGLVKAMYQQISPSFLQNDQVLYIAKVKYNRKIYFVYGTYAEWKLFFRMALGEDPDW